MSFQAKRLRVQLPCGEGTVFEHEVTPELGCPFPTGCVGGTIIAGTCGAFHSPCPYAFESPVCQGLASLCGAFTGCRLYGTDPCQRFGTNCGFVTPGGCGRSEPPGPDPETIVVSPEQLALLRRRLEDQLAEIEKAEEQLKDREASE